MSTPVALLTVGSKRAITEVTPTMTQQPLVGNKRALTDLVTAQAAREALIAQVANQFVDGSHHPHIASDMKKIPASDWERSWLLDYFVYSPPSRVGGNYYRYVV